MSFDTYSLPQDAETRNPVPLITLPAGVTVDRFKARSEPNACMGLPSPYRFYVLGYRGDEIVFCEGGDARDRRDGLTLAARRIAELEAAR